MGLALLACFNTVIFSHLHGEGIPELSCPEAKEVLNA
jgi:hypothetical protein